MILTRHFFAQMGGGFAIFRLSAEREAEQLFVLGCCHGGVIEAGRRQAKRVCEGLDEEAAEAEDAVP